MNSKGKLALTSSSFQRLVLMPLTVSPLQPGAAEIPPTFFVHCEKKTQFKVILQVAQPFVTPKTIISFTSPGFVTMYELIIRNSWENNWKK